MRPVSALSASLNFCPSSPAVAFWTRAVTSVISTSWFTSSTGHLTSSAPVFAWNPSAMKSFLALERSCRQPSTQWWFVSTSPLGETKLAEQPWARRADESRTWSSQASSTLTPYRFSSWAFGKPL